ncbi:MAG TPA: bifunctional phosphoglucose/phosphomannose isomerase [Candidatus Paceibacterota bacterium]|nr:bifunctional phosphoglucose/phosphomannose isomerase [Candidatus Paceibacterota bacterium]
MKESILNFSKQFGFRPQISNSDNFKKNNYKNFVLGGMGGSHLPAKILKSYNPSISLQIHSDYGIPQYSDDYYKETLFIASSYSGNTEETIDFLDEAYSRGFATFVISTGGKLIDFAEKNNIPYIKIPNTGIQPRVAVGFSTIALASIVTPDCLNELFELEKTINPSKYEKEGNQLSESLNQKIPVIYTANSDNAIGYIWKIKINETAKIPCFQNEFPELNHNEMQSYDFVDANRNLSEKFHLLIIKDSDEDSRISNRMSVLEKLFEEKGIPVTSIYMEGSGRFEKIFNSIILSDWCSLGLANLYGVNPEKVDFIEEFKKRISQ